MKDEKKGFAICDNKGFHIRFKNGCVVSVQFGNFNYCENRTVDYKKDENPQQSNNAEVAVWDKKGKWLTKKAFKDIEKVSDSVVGWITPDQLAKVINRVSKWK